MSTNTCDKQRASHHVCLFAVLTSTLPYECLYLGCVSSQVFFLFIVCLENEDWLGIRKETYRTRQASQGKEGGKRNFGAQFLHLQNALFHSLNSSCRMINWDGRDYMHMHMPHVIVIVFGLDFLALGRFPVRRLKFLISNWIVSVILSFQPAAIRNHFVNIYSRKKPIRVLTKKDTYDFLSLEIFSIEPTYERTPSAFRHAS